MNNFTFDPIQFIYNLKWMGIGMLGVFMIVGIIIVATYLINHICNRLAENKAIAEAEAKSNDSSNDEL